MAAGRTGSGGTRLRTAVVWVGRLEAAWDRAVRRVSRRLGWRKPVRLLPYRGYGDASRVRLRLRALENPRLPEARPNDTRLTALTRMIRRFETDEVAYAKVKAGVAGETAEFVADEEGHAQVALDGLNLRAEGELTWQRVRLEFLGDGGGHVVGEGAVSHAAAGPAEGQALIVPPDAGFGVISDVDDTVLVTGAHTLWLNLYNSLLHEADQRVAFPGVASFYQALQRGSDGRPANPIFYVSSSPWNLYDMLERFMRLRGIPVGPMFLRDLGISGGKLVLKGNHGAHKIGAIENLLDFYPNLPFILIGDSGQHDAEIYRRVAAERPGRVMAVYIRDVSPDPSVREEVAGLLAEVERQGVPAILCPDMTKAAAHAREQGWIAADDPEKVEREAATHKASDGKETGAKPAAEPKQAA